jgi:hypothetical protein|tara:strand:- start:3323 stop:3550 length:228 start_codon:yes stop_codon:yes gene_type:complete
MNRATVAVRSVLIGKKFDISFPIDGMFRIDFTEKSKYGVYQLPLTLKNKFLKGVPLTNLPEEQISVIKKLIEEVA